MPKGAKKISLLPRGTWSDFLEPAKEERIRSREKVRRANDHLEEGVRTLKEKWQSRAWIRFVKHERQMRSSSWNIKDMGLFVDICEDSP